MKPPAAQIRSNDEIIPGTYLLWLNSPPIAGMAKPGQYVMIRCGGGNEFPIRRPLSIHRIEGDDCAFLFRKTGKGTGWLSEQKIGGNIDIIGPLGNGFSINSASHNLVMVAGGIGIAPLRFLVDNALEQGKKIALLMGASSAVDLLPIETSLTANIGDRSLPAEIDIHRCTEDGSSGYQGNVTELIDIYKSDRIDQVFACGPPAMYRELATRRNELGLKGKPVQVSLEMRMGCGLGICYACTINTSNGLKQVCRDGPVFELADIIWDELSTK